MTLRNKFITFCNAQQNAEELLRIKGPDHSSVKEAFKKSNDLKRHIQDALEEIENKVQE
jgi:ferritin